MDAVFFKGVTVGMILGVGLSGLLLILFVRLMNWIAQKNAERQ